jgi:hypothetical protein
MQNYRIRLSDKTHAFAHERSYTGRPPIADLFRTHADLIAEGGVRDDNAFLLRGKRWLPL